ncbi:MAG: FAD-binding oxidoreductase [Rhodobacteraceae bacterium]|nr:FAD-binding oxidoreductase [Paracoccaceae bacterium]
MNPLHLNDRPGQYPPSWYADTADIAPERPRLKGAHKYDLAILGAGYTGLWAALTAARAGLSVAVVEAQRVGFGASGRNGGQVGSGYNKPQSWLEAKLGADKARALWDLAEGGKAQLRGFCEMQAPECAYRAGVVHAAYSAAETKAEHQDAAFLADRYGYKLDCLGPKAMQELVKSPSYQGGTFDRGAGHIHPLRYVLALARAAEAAGVVIFERSEVHAIERGKPAQLRTGQGHVSADHLIIAGNGYLPNIEGQISAYTMPINSFIAATEPLENWRDILAEDIAVADSKFVVNYFRFSEDKRFLFGGRESYSIGFPKDISTALATRMQALFPQLANVKISHIWGGTLGITPSRLPHLARISPNILSAAGFSGHGVALSGMAGRVMAEAVIGQASQFYTFSSLPVPRFPGGSMFRAPVLALAMSWFSLRDRIGI